MLLFNSFSSSRTCLSCPPVVDVKSATDSRITFVIMSLSSLFSFLCASFISTSLFMIACSLFAPSLCRMLRVVSPFTLRLACLLTGVSSLVLVHVSVSLHDDVDVVDFVFVIVFSSMFTLPDPADMMTTGSVNILA